jgi:AAA+ superfamily predicted ATPase
MNESNVNANISTSVIAPIKKCPPVKKWVTELVSKWNSQTYSLFVLHGNIFDVFPVRPNEKDVNYVSLKTYMTYEIFKGRALMLFYDISDGLSFGNREMQGDFYQWLEIYDKVENTNYAQNLPKDFIKLAPILKSYFLKKGEEKKGVTMLVDFAEKIIPASDSSGMSNDERKAVVSLLKWGIAPEIRNSDIGIFLITEAITELHADIVRNPHFAQIEIGLPDRDDRSYFLQSGWVEKQTGGKELGSFSEIAYEDLADRTSGLNIVRMQHFLGEAIHNNKRVTPIYIADAKKKLIEEYCQGLVKFIEPNPKLTLDNVATHKAAKEKLRELAWLIKNNKKSVLERGVLLPGRVGVGKSFLVYCFASECGLPVLEIGDFRSKWVGDSEKQQSRILMVIKALGPVVISVDEADATFGNRGGGGDSGVSTRIFAGFAAHIGDSSLRGRELWIAMTSRPDLMAIDMKRQGRFGLCIPLFPAQSGEELKEMFSIVAKTYSVAIDDEIMKAIELVLGEQKLTGSEVESMVIRAKERAVLARRDDNVTSEDFISSIKSFIDPLDPNLLALQEFAAVLACSDRRYLPEQYLNAKREDMYSQYLYLKGQLDTH